MTGTGGSSVKWQSQQGHSKMLLWGDHENREEGEHRAGAAADVGGVQEFLGYSG